MVGVVPSIPFASQKQDKHKENILRTGDAPQYNLVRHVQINNEAERGSRLLQKFVEQFPLTERSWKSIEDPRLW